MYAQASPQLCFITTEAMRVHILKISGRDMVSFKNRCIKKILLIDFGMYKIKAHYEPINQRDIIMAVC